MAHEIFENRRKFLAEPGPPRHLSQMATGNIVVAIPVKNEEALISSCLEGLIAQTRCPHHIVLLLNNCTDRTRDICRELQRGAPNIKIEDYELIGTLSSAGEARRLALDHALRMAGDGLILTTDADASPNSTWIADNVAEIEAGADAVCGMAELGSADMDAAICRLKFNDMREKLLLELLDEISALVDPDTADPWPRHQQNSGASIAVRAALLGQVGGAPQLANGEDRALIERLRLVDARIRHAPHIKVSVSGRLEGRAAGGMAETMKRRMLKPDELLDEAVEPVVDAYRRVLARGALRSIRQGQGGGDQLARDLLLNPERLRRALQSPFFGTAWAEIQRESPVLHRRQVHCADLARETRQALALLKQLKAVTARTGHERSACSMDLPFSRVGNAN
jgi:GT2 family glycosyltransferase